MAPGDKLEPPDELFDCASICTTPKANIWQKDKRNLDVSNCAMLTIEAPGLHYKAHRGPVGQRVAYISTIRFDPFITDGWLWHCIHHLLPLGLLPHSQHHCSYLNKDAVVNSSRCGVFISNLLTAPNDPGISVADFLSANAVVFNIVISDTSMNSRRISIRRVLLILCRP